MVGVHMCAEDEDERFKENLRGMTEDEREAEHDRRHRDERSQGILAIEDEEADEDNEYECTANQDCVQLRDG